MKQKLPNKNVFVLRLKKEKKKELDRRKSQPKKNDNV